MKPSRAQLLALATLATICLTADAQGPPPASDPPNVVMIAVDTLRADHLGCYGYHRPTSPNIDRLASQSVLFERAYSPASWTLPAFMSIFTGLGPEVHECLNIERCLPGTIPTLAEQFQRRGYFCGAVISNRLAGAKYGFARGFDAFDEDSVPISAEIAFLQRHPDRREVSHREIITSPIVTSLAKGLLERARESRKPFFLFILYYDPHGDYAPPPPYKTMFDPDYLGPIDGNNIHLISREPPVGRDLEHLKALYDGEIAFTDRHIGDLLEALDDGGEPEDTITIFLSDHGEAFGEHGLFAHGSNAHVEEVAVPMIWRWPGKLPAGHRVTSPVSTLDVAKTLQALMRFEGFDLLCGKSLWAGLRGGQLPADRVVFSQRAKGSPRHLAATKGHLRLHVRFGENPQEEQAEWFLHDVSTDRQEQSPATGADLEPASDIRAEIISFWEECAEIREHYSTQGQHIQLTDEERRRLESMGYIGGGQ